MTRPFFIATFITCTKPNTVSQNEIDNLIFFFFIYYLNCIERFSTFSAAITTFFFLRYGTISLILSSY